MYTHKKIKNSSKIVKTLTFLAIPMAVVLLINLIFQSFNAWTVTPAKAEAAPILVENLGDKANAENVDETIPTGTFLSLEQDGITVYAGNFKLVTPPFAELKKEKWISADLCYDLIDDGDWRIDNTYLSDAKGHSAPWVQVDAIEITLPPTLVDGKLKQKVLIHQGEAVGDNMYREAVSANRNMGQRCDTVLYKPGTDFDPSQFNLVVANLISYPQENEQCSEQYGQKIQSILDERNLAIKVKSVVSSSETGGACGVEIVEIPKDMPDEEARSIVYGHEMDLDLFGIRGIWTFEGSIP